MNERRSNLFQQLGRLFVLLATGGIASIAVALGPTVPISDLHPGIEHRRETRLITHVLTNFHYKKLPLDDAMSEQIMKRYLDALDPARSYFLASDVAEIKRHGKDFDDYLNNSDLQPVYDMFIRLRERVSERVAYAISLLDAPMDFTVAEDFVFDREKAPWPETRGELDDLWRKRVKNDFLNLMLTGKAAPEIKETLRKRYEEMDRINAQRNSEDIYQIFVNAYTTSLDPHTAYFSPRTSENFRIRMSLSLEGIGAQLQGENEFTVVREVIAGGPAALSGSLHAGDRIVGVGQGADEAIVDVIGWRLDDVVDRIRGPKGTTVRLDILPKGGTTESPRRTLTLVRNEIKLEDQAAQLKMHDFTADGVARHVAVITLPTFYLDFDAQASGKTDYRSSTRDVRRLIGELPPGGVDGLLVDLRNNSGGSLSEATELTGLFIDRGPVVQVRFANGQVQVERDTDPGVAYSGPMAVLVDRNSASAAEIFASAIQDYGRGAIIGEPTFGKGTVQELVDLNNFDRDMNGRLGQVKTTKAQFFRVQGGSTQHKGVVPDLTMPTAGAAEDQGERSFDNALPWAQIEPARYQPLNAVGSLLDSVRALHERRVQNDQAILALVEAERAFSTEQAKTTVSLREQDRRAEYEQNRKAQRDRENRLRVARGLAPLTDDAATSPTDEDTPTDDNAGERERYDVVLDEATRIVADFAALSNPRGVRVANDTATGVTQ